MSHSPRFRKEVEKQLGMSESKASARLKKNILFNLIKRVGEDACYRCETKIETAEALSVDHKQEWLHSENAKNLFWDLDNIGFSHLHCNRPRSLKGKSNSRRQIAPDGEAWCLDHQRFLPKDLFYKHKNRHNGVNHICKECFLKRNKQRYDSLTNEELNSLSKQKRIYYEKNKTKLLEKDREKRILLKTELKNRRNELYETNKESINEKRRRRYKFDKAYRNKVLERGRLWRSNKLGE